MKNKMTRRDFVRGTALISTTMAVSGNPLEAVAADSPAPAGPNPACVGDPMPTGKIGNQVFSRLMLGGNLISGYSHSRDLAYVSALMKRYNTETKIRETLELAESHGINVMNLWIMDGISYLKNHWKNGGKMKFIAQARIQRDDEMMQFKKAVDEGASAVHMNGDSTDDLALSGRVALVAKSVEYVKSRGVAAGIGAHGFKTLETCLKAGIEADFYQKTLHELTYKSAPRSGDEFSAYDIGTWDNAWCRYPEEVIDLMAPVKKPWIAFKILAAGAIKPHTAMPFAVNAGADFLLVGMFDWQVADDVKLAKEAFKNAKRTRPICG